MIRGQLAQMHAESGHQTIEDQLKEGHQQHELDRVLKEERLIAQFPGDSFNGRCSGRHECSNSQKIMPTGKKIGQRSLAVLYDRAAVTARRSSALARAM